MTNDEDVNIGIEIVADVLEELLRRKIQEIKRQKKSRRTEGDLYWEYLDETSKESPVFELESTKYVSRLFQKYDRVKILGMTDSIPLKNLFVKAYVLENIRSREISAEEEIKTELDKFRNKEDRVFYTNSKEGKVEALQIVIQKNKNQSGRNFILLGKPGSGKSTFLKYVSLQVLREKKTLENHKIPVFVSVKEYLETNRSLLDYIVDKFAICEFNDTYIIVQELLKRGKLLVLLDGLDESGTTAQLLNAVNSLKALSEEYYLNQFIVSCRTASYFNWFENFSDVEVADFDESQSLSFVKNFFKGKNHNIEELKHRILTDSSIKELSASPLLLTFLCIYFQGNSRLTTNRADLYQEAIEVLLKRWDSTRGFRRERLYKNFTERHELNLLSEFAFFNFIESRYFFKQSEVVAFFENYLFDKVGVNDVDGSELLNDMESCHGLIFERNRNLYSFAHLTIQEYFTARYIFTNSLNGMLDEALDKYLGHPEWREVFLVLFNMANNESTLDYIVNGIKRYIKRMSLEEPRILELWRTISRSKSYYSFANNYTLFLCALDKAEATSRRDYQVLIETYSTIFRILKIKFNDYRVFAREGIDMRTAQVIEPIYDQIKQINQELLKEYTIALLRLIECLKEVDILSDVSRTNRILESLEIFLPFRESK